SLSCGPFSTAAVAGDGHAYAWGYNAYGQLGDGTTANMANPVQVRGENTVMAISSGATSTCDLHADGTLWCWGGNFYGQLGDGTTNTRGTAAKVTLPAAAKSVGVGYA